MGVLEGLGESMDVGALPEFKTVETGAEGSEETDTDSVMDETGSVGRSKFSRAPPAVRSGAIGATARDQA